MKASTNSFFDFSTNLFHFFFHSNYSPNFRPRPLSLKMSNASSSPEQMQIEFTPLMLTSEPIFVPNGSFVLSMLPEEILLKIGNFADIRTVLNLIATCKYFRNRPNIWFLQVLASENNPDRATSGFIVDAIGNKGDTCLWHNAKFFIKDHDIPKELSIHLFANTTAKKTSSDEVRSMIIQVSGLSSPPDLSNPSDPHHNIRKFLTFLFLKVSFKSLKCLMVCGIELSNEFSKEIETLKLDVFHMRNFHYHTYLAQKEFYCYCNPLKTLYVVHPDGSVYVKPPEKLEKLVIYCPKLSKDIIGRRGAAYTQLSIDMVECHVLNEM